MTKTMCSVTLEIVKFKKSVEIESGLCCSERWEFWYWGETEIPITADRFSKPRAAVHCLRCSMRSSAKSLKHFFFFLSQKFSIYFLFYFIFWFYTWHVFGVIFCSRNFLFQTNHPSIRSNFFAPFYPFWFISLNFICYNNFS